MLEGTILSNLSKPFSDFIFTTTERRSPVASRTHILSVQCSLLTMDESGITREKNARPAAEFCPSISRSDNDESYPSKEVSQIGTTLIASSGIGVLGIFGKPIAVTGEVHRFHNPLRRICSSKVCTPTFDAVGFITTASSTNANNVTSL